MPRDSDSLIPRCPNANDSKKSDRGVWYLQKWAAIYLADALARLQAQISGYTLTIEDVYTMQQTCAYEVFLNIFPIYSVLMIHVLQTVALGYSKYCELFTEDEWEGFDYG